MCGGNFEQAKMFIEGLSFSFKLGGHGKAGVTDFFFCEKYWGLNLK